MGLTRRPVDCLLRAGTGWNWLENLSSRGSTTVAVSHCCVSIMSIFVRTVTYGHENWIMTQRTRLQVQVAEMSFPRKVAGFSLRDRVRDRAPPSGGAPSMSSCEEAHGQTEDQVERLYLHPGLGTCQDPPVRAGWCHQGKGSLRLSVETTTRPQTDEDGWTDVARGEKLMQSVHEQ